MCSCTHHCLCRGHADTPSFPMPYSAIVTLHVDTVRTYVRRSNSYTQFICVHTYIHVRMYVYTVHTYVRTTMYCICNNVLVTCMYIRNTHTLIQTYIHAYIFMYIRIRIHVPTYIHILSLYSCAVSLVWNHLHWRGPQGTGQAFPHQMLHMYR